jgi:phage regulator Rha-like protein
MHLDEQRRVENFALVCPLKHVEDPDMLAFLATLIQDHDHLREKLLTEPSVEKRKQKLDAMRPHLHFKAHTLETYMMAEVARTCGVQPVYDEQEKAEQSRIWMPESRVHEVPQ